MQSKYEGLASKPHFRPNHSDHSYTGSSSDHEDNEFLSEVIYELGNNDTPDYELVEESNEELVDYSSEADSGDGNEGDDESDIFKLRDVGAKNRKYRRKKNKPRKRRGSSVMEAVLNFTNSIIGAGIIGLPYAFNQSGFVLGVILLTGLTFLVDWTVVLLVRTGKLAGKSTYQDVMAQCFGRPGFILISVFQFVFAFGGMCAYTVIIGDTLPLVLRSVFSISSPTLLALTSRHTIITLCTVFICLPLSMYKDITKLAKTSAVSMFAIVVIVGAVLLRGPAVEPDLRGNRDLRWSVFGDGIFQAIGVISFAFVCHHNTFIIFSSLETPTIRKFALVAHISTFISFASSIILAWSGYWSFTDKTKGNILNNFHDQDLLINFARFCFSLNMFTTFPMECFVAREVIQNYFYPFPLKTMTHKQHVLWTLGLVFAVWIISMTTCDLGFVLEVTGGFSATALAYILPPLLYIKLSDGPMWTKANLPHWCCIIFGFSVMVISTILAISNWWSGEGSGKKCV